MNGVVTSVKVVALVTVVALLTAVAAGGRAVPTGIAVGCGLSLLNALLILARAARAIERAPREGAALMQAGFFARVVLLLVTLYFLHRVLPPVGLWFVVVGFFGSQVLSLIIVSREVFAK